MIRPLVTVMVLPSCDVNVPLAPLFIGVTAPVTALTTTGTVVAEAATPPAPRVNAPEATALELRSVLLLVLPLNPTRVALGMVKEGNPILFMNVIREAFKALLVIVAPVNSQLLKKINPVNVEGIVTDPLTLQLLKIRLPEEVPETTKLCICTLSKECPPGVPLIVNVPETFRLVKVQN